MPCQKYLVNILSNVKCMVILFHIYIDIFSFNSVSEHFTKTIYMLAHQNCKNGHTVFTKVMGGGKLNAVRKISRIKPEEATSPSYPAWQADPYGS